MKRLRHLALPLAMVVSFATGACDDEDKTDKPLPARRQAQRQKRRKPHRRGPCRPGDLSGCTTLCEAGDAVSCQRLAKYGTSSEVSEEGGKSSIPYESNAKGTLVA